MTVVNSLIVNEVLRVQDLDAKRLGLDRLDEDALILGFARWAEGQLKKWLDYAKGALLFVMVPEEPESGMFYIYDRARQTFFMVDLAEAGRYGDVERLVPAPGVVVGEDIVRAGHDAAGAARAQAGRDHFGEEFGPVGLLWRHGHTLPRGAGPAAHCGPGRRVGYPRPVPELP